MLFQFSFRPLHSLALLFCLNECFPNLPNSKSLQDATTAIKPVYGCCSKYFFLLSHIVDLFDLSRDYIVKTIFLLVKLRCCYWLHSREKSSRLCVGSVNKDSIVPSWNSLKTNVHLTLWTDWLPARGLHRICLNEGRPQIQDSWADSVLHRPTSSTFSQNWSQVRFTSVHLNLLPVRNTNKKQAHKLEEVLSVGSCSVSFVCCCFCLF